MNSGGDWQQAMNSAPEPEDAVTVFDLPIQLCSVRDRKRICPIVIVIAGRARKSHGSTWKSREGGGKMAERWRRDGGKMAGRWRGDGGEVADRHVKCRRMLA